MERLGKKIGSDENCSIALNEDGKRVISEILDSAQEEENTFEPAYVNGIMIRTNEDNDLDDGLKEDINEIILTSEENETACDENNNYYKISSFLIDNTGEYVCDMMGNYLVIRFDERKLYTSEKRDEILYAIKALNDILEDEFDRDYCIFDRYLVW